MIEYWVEAEDNNNVTGPGVGTSEHQLAKVVSESDKRADLLNRAGDYLGSINDVATDQETRLSIEFHSPRMQRNRKFAEAGRYLDTARLHPNGKAIALTTRGKAFAFYNHDGPVLQYGKRDGVRYRLPEWLNDGRNLVLISDDPGEEALVWKVR